ncbi:uncharacterized protein LOC115149076 [Salmo trutta]|uniref:uncharacterized protein LOC115149076 n=1 Tax=Salmo trutta TaxID=8032 RepID=UPI0011316303|nr:uncharacterized protein LOC115149076 [Salmo trutta]XP_029547442.1 uncharacterized protein LOC115149076 [Salmo trutta]XP_029547443.1 uncharacterized protein LOC115149076 [Salmo trutta]
MKVVLMNIGTSAMTTVNVDNKDDADKVIRILTQQLRLTGRPTDYRFWVVSGREEAPYPLIGTLAGEPDELFQPGPLYRSQCCGCLFPLGQRRRVSPLKRLQLSFNISFKTPQPFLVKMLSAIFTEPKNEQGTVEDVMVESYQQINSSDYWDWEKQEGLHSPNREPFFLPLEKLVLKEILGLLNEVDSLKKQHVTEDSAYSCGNLDLMSSLSSGSICSLMGTQSFHSARCSSEPIVCLSSPLLGSHSQLYTPVARQSSCDAAVMSSCRPLPTHTQIPH